MAVCSPTSEFVHSHRPHDPLTTNATEPAWNGHLLTVACSCGVTFRRWITPRRPARIYSQL